MKNVNVVNRNNIKCIRIYLLFAFSILHFPFSILLAQDTAHISLTARVQQDAILLRWGATTPMAWQQTNHYGFRIERYTVMRNKQLLPQIEKTILSEIVKAQPIERWVQIAIADDHAAIIAQALYGEDFELTGSDAQGIARIINLSQQLEQRFAMSLFAADHNFEAACLAGWGWRDTDIKPGEKYLYRVIPLAPTHIMTIDTGYVYTSIDQYETLPQPLELAAIFGDHSVMLTWNYEQINGVYNSYFVEKSTDGKNFTRLPGLPVSNLNNRKGQTAQRMFFSDSLAHNGQIYHYRICGLNAFGETGPSSEAVSGQGQKLLTHVPNITRAVVNEQGTMELEWEFEEQSNTLISGFVLNQSENANSGFTTVQRNLSPSQRKTTYKDLLPANYFTISAISKEGVATVSFPVLVQPLDTVPPATPVGISGTIDTTGVVTLQWIRNRETDLLGYKVYRALRKGDELLPLFDIAVRDTVYQDTIDIRSLNTQVYYAVSAVDLRYNQSALCKVLELHKPMVVLPSSPIISGYHTTADGIRLEWINSPDDGVTEHRLYRKVKDNPDSIRILLQSFAGNQIKSYTDTSTAPEVRYIYTLTASYANGLESLPSPALTVSGNRNPKLEINRFEATTNKKNGSIRLIWSNNLANVKTYELYKSANGQPPTLWKVLPASVFEITDNNVPKGNYQYLLRPIYENGKNAQSKNVSIKW